MLENVISYIHSIITAYGAWGVFAATLIEEAVAPIPSPLVPLAAGFFLLPAYASLGLVILKDIVSVAFPVALGIGIGSSAVYAIGYFGGRPLIERSRKLLGVSWQDIEKAEKRLTRGAGDEIALFVLRILPIVPGVAVSGFCGVVRYPFYRFATITLVGAFVRAFALGILGWQVGGLYAAYADMLDKIENYIFAGVIILGLLLAGFYWKKKRY